MSELETALDNLERLYQYLEQSIEGKKEIYWTSSVDLQKIIFSGMLTTVCTLKNLSADRNLTTQKA